MTYQPVIPFSGYAGWQFLNRTLETQKAVFTESSEIQRNEDYFRDRIGSVRTAKDLVSDRRLLSVALGAFGLDEDINNKYFIQKVLEEGTLDNTSLANKLSDRRYRELAKAFGFGDYTTPHTVLSNFPDKILGQYETRQFEIAVGEADTDLRLAMSIQRELPALAAKDSSETTKWYTIIGSTTMSRVLQVALNLPSSVGSLDVDQQINVYAKKAEAIYGSSDPAQFTDRDAVDKLVRDFLLRSQLASGSTISPESAALMLLQGTGTASGLSLLL